MDPWRDIDKEKDFHEGNDCKKRSRHCEKVYNNLLVFCSIHFGSCLFAHSVEDNPKKTGKRENVLPVVRNW